LNKTNVPIDIASFDNNVRQWMLLDITRYILLGPSLFKTDM